MTLMIRANIWLLALISALASGSLWACGDDGGAPPVDAAAIDAALIDASLDCSAPTVVEGMPCAVEGQTCGGPCEDQCSFCNLLNCSGGMWTRLEVFPAPCFACGTELQCVQDTEYCHIEHPDVGGQPDTFECPSMPAACAGDPSCACLGGEIAFDTCSGDPGSVTVETSGG